MSEIEKLMQEAREIAVNYAMLHDHIAEKIVTLAYAAGRKAGREEAAALCFNPQGVSPLKLTFILLTDLAEILAIGLFIAVLALVAAGA